jgi:hypothetical protein
MIKAARIIPKSLYGPALGWGRGGGEAVQDVSFHEESGCIVHFLSNIHSFCSSYLLGNIQLLFAISLGYSFILFYVFLVECVGVFVIFIFIV